MTSWTIAQQALLSLELSRQEYRSGLPFPSPKGEEVIPKRQVKNSEYLLEMAIPYSLVFLAGERWGEMQGREGDAVGRSVA